MFWSVNYNIQFPKLRYAIFFFKKKAFGFWAWAWIHLIEFGSVKEKG